MYKKVFLILSSLILNSCHINFGERDISSTPSTSTDNCRKNIKYISKFSIKRLKYLKKVKEQYNKNNIKEFKDMVWTSHDNSKIKLGEEPMKGFNILRARTSAWLGDKNRIKFIPSYYQFNDEEDVFGIIYSIIHEKSLKDHKKIENLKEAMSGATSWIKKYNGYKERLFTKIDEGFTAKLHEKTLEKYYEEIESPSFSNFDGTKTYKVNMPFVEDNKIIYKEIEYGDHLALKAALKDASKSRKVIFTRNILEEWFYKSEVYNEIISQALLYRKLNFLKYAIKEINPSKRSIEQKNLLIKIESALKNSKILPRSDAVAAVQRRELRSELKTLLRSRKSQREIRSSVKYKLAKDVISITENEVNNKLNLRIVFTAAVSSAVIGLLGLLLLPVEGTPYLKYSQGVLVDSYNDIILSIFGLTPQMVVCAKASRKFTFEQFCVAEFLLKHTSSYVHKARMDKDYIYTKDPEYREKVQYLLNELLKVRDEWGYAEHHGEIIEYLSSEGYRHYIDSILIDIVETNHANDKNLSHLVKSLIDANINKDSKKQNQILATIKEQYGQDIYNAFLKYTENIDIAIDSFSNHSILPRERADVVKFIKELEEEGKILLKKASDDNEYDKHNKVPGREFKASRGQIK